MLSVVVPVYNEADGLKAFHASLLDAVQGCAKDAYEIIYCDDGSTDQTTRIIKGLRAGNSRLKLVRLSRNFGKESALAAGMAMANGQAVITLDGDGQHPVELIPKFLAAWQGGAQVVVGVRTNNNSSFFRRFGSRLFYQVFNRFTNHSLLPGSTDYCLLDRSVRQAFLDLREGDRLTRGLIDWLGFDRKLIYFEARGRVGGSPGYEFRKLMHLAANSFVSLSPTPLYWFGYLGIFITLAALLLGLAVIVEQLLLNDPWHWKFTGTAMLGILTLFLVGLVLLSQGILSLYISRIHNQSKRRPLYVIDYKNSAGIEATVRHED